MTNEQLVYTVAGDGGRSPVVLDDAASPVRVPASGVGTAVVGSGTVGRDGVELPTHGWAVLTGRLRRIAGTGDGGVAPAGRLGVH